MASSTDIRVIVANSSALAPLEFDIPTFKIRLALQSKKLNYNQFVDLPAYLSDFAPFVKNTCIEIVSEKRLIFNPNSAVRYLVGETAGSEDKVAVLNQWIEWEETELLPAINNGSISAQLKKLEKLFAAGSILKNIAESTALEIIFYASLTSIFEFHEKVSHYPSIGKWISSIKTKDFTKLSGLLPQNISKSQFNPLDHHSRTVLPKEGEKNVLITSALPYVNNVPHLGNIIGCVLSADVHARFSRLRGHNTLFICGTDEYGTATETKALEEKISCQELCDKYHKVHKKVYEWFGIDFDYFGRTTTAAQTKITQEIFNQLDENGFISEDTMNQLYCPKHQSFLADRFVEGICPGCKSPGARGDQCDNCGKTFNANELIEPRCKLCNVEPISKDSKHLFLDLPALEEKCQEWIEKSSAEGKWSANGIQIARLWMKEGLRPQCITRDLKWGTPVPKKGFENKVFYVWFDACIGYPSITANYTDKWESWWKNPDNVSLYQFMGKDNVRFHTIIFPSSLIGSGEKWTMLHHLATTEYLQYEGAKFSKSRGTGVFGDNVMESGIPVEVYRYYLLDQRPETGDTQFYWKDLVAANNNVLLANFGNFVNRVVKFVKKEYECVIPKFKVTEEPEATLIKKVNELLKQYNELMEDVKIRAALKIVMEISSLGNTYLQDNRIDRKLFTNQRERCDNVVATALNLAYLLGSLIYPFMPTTAESVWKQLNAWPRNISESWNADDILTGHTIGEPAYLFQLIDEKRAEELRLKYSGQKPAEVKPAEIKPNEKGKKSAKAEVVVSDGPKTPEVIELEAKIAEQGDKVRKLKAEKADAAVVKKEVDTLLSLKEALKSAQSAAAKAAPSVEAPKVEKPKKEADANSKKSQKKVEKAAGEIPAVVGEKSEKALAIEEKVAAQGEVVRKLKSEKADAATIKKEVDVLLKLKEELKAALLDPSAPKSREVKEPAIVPAPKEVKPVKPAPVKKEEPKKSPLEILQEKFAAQGDKIRKMRADGADNAAIAAEFKVLMGMKAELNQATAGLK